MQNRAFLNDMVFFCWFSLVNCLSVTCLRNILVSLFSVVPPLIQRDYFVYLAITNPSGFSYCFSIENWNTFVPTETNQFLNLLNNHLIVFYIHGQVVILPDFTDKSICISTTIRPKLTGFVQFLAAVFTKDVKKV